MGPMTRMGDLLGPDPVLLPGDSEAEAELAASENPAIVAAAHPSASVAWAALAAKRGPPSVYFPRERCKRS